MKAPDPMMAHLTLAEEEALIAYPMHDIGPQYANLFTKLTNVTWHYTGKRVSEEYNHPLMHFNLVRADTGAVIHISADRHKRHVTARPSTPPIQDGSEHLRNTILRDFMRVPTTIEAGVGLGRFLSEPETCARRFVKLVVEPYAEVWPEIMAHIAAVARQYQTRNDVAHQLATQFNGRVRIQGSHTSVWFPGTELPPLSVDAGGSIRFQHTPSLTMPAIIGLFNAMRTTKREDVA